MKTLLDVSVIIIGRNEGARLASCLESVAKANWDGVSYEVIYIDSHSTDDSLATAASYDAKAIPLDDDRPCAAKARNLGISQANGQLILFLDGDTILDADFVHTAIKALDSAPQTCAVWGHRREILPNQSIFTKVMDLDWIYPIGKTLYFGGDVLIRRSALDEVNGYDPTLKAGEEPEMCARLRAAGWEIEHIDVPMTLHDLAVNTFKGYWLRAYRSGIAYAELAERMRKRGDSLWQKDSKRDYLHGWLYLLSPALFLSALLMPKYIGLSIIGIGILGVGLIIAKTALGCKWKSPHDPILIMEYAVHVHLQKIPSLFGQLAWRKNHEASQKLIEYKTLTDSQLTSTRKGKFAKRFLINALTPLAKLWIPLVTHGWNRVWGLACLRAQVQHDVDASNVIQGSVEIHGTGNIRFGKNVLIYPGCYLETQDDGEIILGDDIVLSRGVHIVAFTKVSIGNGTIIGEYSSVRDANHRLSSSSIRNSGHDTQAISIGENVWLAKGVTVLKGVAIGNNAVVAAGAVVNRSVPANDIVAGLPARPIKARSAISATPL